MEKFFSLIFTLLLIFFVLRLFFRLVMPLALKLFLKRMSKKFGTQPEEKSENDFTYRPKKDKNGQTLSEKLGGEYVDFEEVKE